MVYLLLQVKNRWAGKTIVDLFAEEFKGRPYEYYVRITPTHLCLILMICLIVTIIYYKHWSTSHSLFRMLKFDPLLEYNLSQYYNTQQKGHIKVVKFALVPDRFGTLGESSIVTSIS